MTLSSEQRTIDDKTKFIYIQAIDYEARYGGRKFPISALAFVLTHFLNLSK